MKYFRKSVRSGALSLLMACVIAAFAVSQDGQHSRDGEIHDPDTLAWWHTTEALSNDSMEGRDTGSAAYQRAADYVAARFKAAGLLPAGEQNSYFQPVPMHEIAAVAPGTRFSLVRPKGSEAPLKFLGQITITPTSNLPHELDAELTFRGYCGKDSMAGITGKIVVCFGTQRANFPSAAARAANVRDGHAAGLISVDDPFFTIEPPRWPIAYARTVTLRADSTNPAEHPQPFALMRVSSAALESILVGSGQDATSLLKAGGALQPLPNFDIPSRLHFHVELAERDISSPNVLAALPGASAALKSEYVVASAHLDGYGYGTPVKGDKLYNGTLDDAAYVALLIRMAEDIKGGKLERPQRSLLFAAFTGEEKGLLGSHWFVEHPTVPLPQLAANVNLDQLRPLFPLNILTAEALTDTTLGETARQVGESLHITLRTDREPERNLLQRADQYPFLTKHVPAISFIFGYDAGTDAERRYREWYEIRYHRPQDDVTQPVDFEAAAKFNQFFFKLISAIAADPRRPEILPASRFAALGQAANGGSTH
jgi:hypothetical protein